MVEVAAHLTDHVLTPLPVRQCVFFLPKRIRPFLPHDPRLAGDVLPRPAPRPPHHAALRQPARSS